MFPEKVRSSILRATSLFALGDLMYPPVVPIQLFSVFPFSRFLDTARPGDVLHFVGVLLASLVDQAILGGRQARKIREKMSIGEKTACMRKSIYIYIYCIIPREIQEAKACSLSFFLPLSIRLPKPPPFSTNTSPEHS